jgi:myo-inositol-1-phosphate synthase
MLVDAIRAVFVAKMQGMSGVLPAACAYFMKSPPKQMQPDEAKRAMLEEIRA